MYSILLYGERNFAANVELNVKIFHTVKNSEIWREHITIVTSKINGALLPWKLWYKRVGTLNKARIKLLSLSQIAELSQACGNINTIITLSETTSSTFCVYRRW